MEKLVPYIDTTAFKTVEDIMLIESIVDYQTITNLWNSYKIVNTKLITEFDHFYICNKKKEVIYKESIR